MRRSAWLVSLLAVFLAVMATRSGDAARSAASPGVASPPATAGTFRIVIPGLSHDLQKRATLAAAGDVMLARSAGARILADGPEVPFAGVEETLRGADIAVVNLECAISDGGEPAPKAYTFRAPPAAADALAAGGIDMVSLANNHSLDYGPGGLADTLANLDARGIAHAGAGANATAARAPVVVVANGLRVAFLSYVDVPVEYGGFDTHRWEATAVGPGVAWLNVEQVQEDVASARRLADLVVVMMHFGFEGRSTPSETQRAQARAAIDAGAALVLGHHPHVLQPVEWYGNGLIVYSLGNFVFDGFDNPANDSAILLADLTEGGVASYRLLPVVVGDDGFPRLADSD